MTAYLLLTKGEASLARRGPFPVITRETGRVVEKARVGNLAALVKAGPRANFLIAIEEAIIN
jgi:hypothetical protein